MVDVVFGIDLGTSGYSVVMFTPESDFEFKPLLDSEELERTPCYVAHFSDTLVRRVGLIAKQIENYQEESFVVYEPKRLIGRSFSDDNVKVLKPFLRYFIRNFKNDDVTIIIERGNKKFCTTLHNVYISILENIKRTILQYIKNCSAIKVVLTVPPTFTDEQRQATYLSARNVGFTLIDFQDEHTAIAKNYFHKYKKLKESELFLIYDLGASDFKISYFKVTDDNWNIVSTANLAGLSGLTFDIQILNYIVDNLSTFPGFYDQFNKDILRQILIKSEEARINLSEATNSTIVLKNIPRSYNTTVEMSRAKFEEIAETLINQTVGVVDQFIKNIGVNKRLVKKIILYGGISRTPKIRQLFVEQFGHKMSEEFVFESTAVAEGAALLGAQLARK